MAVSEQKGDLVSSGLGWLILAWEKVNKANVKQNKKKNKEKKTNQNLENKAALHL